MICWSCVPISLRSRTCLGHRPYNAGAALPLPAGPIRIAGIFSSRAVPRGASSARRRAGTSQALPDEPPRDLQHRPPAPPPPPPHPAACPGCRSPSRRRSPAGRPPRAAATSLRWSPTSTARCRSPRASATVPSRCAGSGLRDGKLSPPPIAANSPPTPSASSISRAGAAGLLVQTASRQPAAAATCSRRLDAGEQPGGLVRVRRVVRHVGADRAVLGLGAAAQQDALRQRLQPVADHRPQLVGVDPAPARGGPASGWPPPSARPRCRPACRPDPAPAGAARAGRRGRPGSSGSCGHPTRELITPRRCRGFDIHPPGQLPPETMSPPVDATAILLAAGLGTRMKSALPKALHPLAGRPMLRHLLDGCASVFSGCVVVAGPDMPALERAAAPWPVVVQQQRLGTAHAARQAVPLFGRGDVAVLYADNPLVTPATLRRLLETRRRGDADLALLASAPGRSRPLRPPGDGTGRGRRRDRAAHRRARRRDPGRARDRPVQRRRAVRRGRPPGRLAGAGPRRQRRRRVLPDRRGGAGRRRGRPWCAPSRRRRPSCAASTRAPSWPWPRPRSSTACARRRWRAGATLVAPETVFLSADTVLGPRRHRASACGVRPPASPSGVRRRDPRLQPPGRGGRRCARAMDRPVRAAAPPAPWSAKAAHVGNFVELKATDLGPGAKANHLAYLGDASVGAAAATSAPGTITCNYDGAAKHRTRIGAGRVRRLQRHAGWRPGRARRRAAFVAAGSVVTEAVPADALAFAAAPARRPGPAAARCCARA